MSFATDEFKLASTIEYSFLLVCDSYVFYKVCSLSNVLQPATFVLMKYVQ